MNGKQSTRFRILFSVALAFLSGLLVYVTLMALPAAATNQFPNWSNGWTPLAPLADTGVFTVTGTVNRQDGTPVGNVQVYAFNATASVETFTNSSGQYTLTLSVGNFYDIVFNPPAETDLASQFRRGVHEGQQGQPLDVTLPPGHSILGTVYSDATQSTPVQGVEIFAFNKTTADDFGLPPTQENGTYQISLEKALWELTFTPPPFMGLGPVRTTINLTGDITKDINLQPGFTVYGQVITGGGGGQAGVEIFAQQQLSQSSGYGFRPTGPGGFYTGTLPSGNFDCLFVAPPFLGLGSTVVTNVSGPPDAERNLELPAGHTVSGTVRCDGGLANAFVFAAPQPPVFAASFGGWGRFAGADGFYALALQTGVYTFTVVPPNDSALPELTVPMVEVQEDLTLDFDYPYITFLPLVLKNMCYSTRPPLHGTANFAGEVEILDPPNCTTGIPAESRIWATGTYTGTPADVTLWVLAYAPNLLYYPQSPNACQGEPPYQYDGDWRVPLYLGKKGGDPEWFDIVVILTDQEASQFLSDWVRRGCQAGEYEGILAATLNAKAITEKSYITVQTLD